MLRLASGALCTLTAFLALAGQATAQVSPPDYGASLTTPPSGFEANLPGESEDRVLTLREMCGMPVPYGATRVDLDFEMPTGFLVSAPEFVMLPELNCITQSEAEESLTVQFRVADDAVPIDSYGTLTIRPHAPEGGPYDQGQARTLFFPLRVVDPESPQAGGSSARPASANGPSNEAIGGLSLVALALAPFARRFF